MRFSGKRVIVTGSTRGIGRETARLFLEAGADVVIHGRTQGSVDETVADLGGGRGLPADLSSLEGCRELVDRALDHLGGLDVLVNNAAVGDGGTIEDSDEALWQATMDVNLRAPFFLTRHALPALRASRGNVVMVSSVSGLMGHPGGITVYCTSKGGLNNMTRAMALELAGEVRVNAVAPGPVDTDMHRIPARQSGDEDGYFTDIDAWVPMGRIGTVGEVARGILWLASDDASLATGIILSLDGGAGAGH